MADNLLENQGGLHNRITRRIYLEPFTLGETEECFKSRDFYCQHSCDPVANARPHLYLQHFTAKVTAILPQVLPPIYHKSCRPILQKYLG